MNGENSFMKKARKIIILLLSIPKTIYLNYKCLPFRYAVKLPILVGYTTRIGALSGQVEIGGGYKPFSIRINWGGTESREEGRKGFLQIGSTGKIIFKGKAIIGKGSSVIVDRGVLSIGDNFFCNRNCCISCNDRIEIGNEAMWGWNVELLDSDNHSVVANGTTKKLKAPISVGDHVWLASYVNVLKGVNIAAGSIVAFRSLVVRDLSKENSIYGGSPAKLINDGISWERN